MMTYQKLKKSRTSCSVVSPPMFLTWTVVDMIMVLQVEIWCD